MLTRSLFSVLFLFVAALSGSAQVERPREFPTEASFTELIKTMQAGTADGFAALRGERLDEEHWLPVCPEGLTPDRSGAPGERRHSLHSFKRVGWVMLTYFFELHETPTEAETEALQADFETLGAWMLAARGDWKFMTTIESEVSTKELVGPNPEDRIELILNHKQGGASGSTWALWLRGTTAWVEDEPFVDPVELEDSKPKLLRPTRAGFGAVVEAMKADAYSGLEGLKGKLAPEKEWGRSGGMVTWSVMPMEGVPIDPEGRRQRMVYYGRTDRDRGLTSVTYHLGWVERPTPEQAAAFEAEFEKLRGWLAAHSLGWGTAEDFEPWTHCKAESRRFALEPLPGTKIFRIDGNPVPQIELLLRKRDLDEGGEGWTLDLTCDGQGQPEIDDGKAEWLFELLGESEPAVELPVIAGDLETTVLALVADAPNSFQNLVEPGEPTEIDRAGLVLQLGDPIYITPRPRQRLAVQLAATPDPRGLRDLVTTSEDFRGRQAEAVLGLVSVRDPNLLTRRAVDLRLEELVERLAAVLPGWLSSIEDLPAGRYENFNVRLGLLKGLRPDGHPIWIGVERMRYPVEVAGQPPGETLQLLLYVTTNHDATVGYDLFGQWQAALEAGKEPIASAVRVLGDPLAGKLSTTDRVVPPVTGPFELPELFGLHGEDGLRLEVVRGGGFEEVMLGLPKVGLERWRELQLECNRGELAVSALSLIGSRLEMSELRELTRALVAAGEGDFEELPDGFADWLVRTDDHQLITLALPLWDAAKAPTPTFVETLRAGLANTFDGHWILEPYTQNSGPFWDWFARQTHWSARHEGPRGTKPWVELAQTVRGDRVVIELEVKAFSEAHRLANAETPERLWFEPIGGNTVDGRGVAYCYREGLSFDGPFANGLPEGTGEHIFADGTAWVDVLYERGRLRFLGHVEPPPPPVSSISSRRADSFSDDYGQTEPSTWRDDWGSTFDASAVGSAPSFDDWGGDDGWRYATCAGCNGSGEAWFRYEVEDFDHTLVLSGTGLWSDGYTGIHTSYGTRTVSEIGPCSYCGGTGWQRY